MSITNRLRKNPNGRKDATETYLVELDHVGVSDLLKDVDFSGDPLNVGLILNLVFFEDFDSHKFARYCMGANSDFTKGSLAKRFSYQNKTN